MKKVKRIALICMLLPLTLMAQHIVSKSRHMRIESAEVSVHYPGIQGAPIMRNYTVIVVLKKEMKSLPDSIFVDGFSEKLILQGNAGEGVLFKKGSKLTYTANITINTAENAENIVYYSPKSSLTTEGVCVIRYYIERKGKKEPFYLRAKTLKKGAEVFAP
jgi:hypothetical protein